MKFKANDINSLDKFLENSPSNRIRYEKMSIKEQKKAEKILKIHVPEWIDDDFYIETFISKEKDEYVARKGVSPIVFRNKNLVNLYDSLPDRNIGLFTDPFSLPKNEIGNRLLISFTDFDRLFLIKSRIYDFYKIAKKYHRNPKSFKNSYKFITNHLMFWTRSNGHWDDVPYVPWSTFIFDRRRKCILEAGPHMKVMNYADTSYDYRLDGYGSTYEKAIIKMAQKIAKYYNDNGTEK